MLTWRCTPPTTATCWRSAGSPWRAAARTSSRRTTSRSSTSGPGTRACAARAAGSGRRPGDETDGEDHAMSATATVTERPSERAAAWTVHGEDTLPRLFRHVVRERGDRVAMREKDLGIWRAITWREYGERARRVGLGLVALGLRPRDVVAIIADNCPEWLYTDMGTLAVGGVTNGIYTTDSPGQVAYIVNDSGARFFFAENEEQLDKILEVRGRCPGLVKIFVYDLEGLHGFADEQVMSFTDLLELGARYEP